MYVKRVLREPSHSLGTACGAGGCMVGRGNSQFTPLVFRMASTSQQIAAAVTAWARDNIGLHSALTIAPGRYGLHVETNAGIRAGTTLLAIPGDLLITSNSARRASKLLGVSTAGVELVHEEAHVAMAVWLMNATAHPEAAPRHAGWLAALPKAFDCTIEWSEAELAHLQASHARSRANNLRRWADAEHGRLISKHAAASGSAWSQERFRWALCAVWSRSFHLQQGSWRVLPPAADFFNHAVAPSVPSAHLEVMTDEETSLDEIDDDESTRVAAEAAVRAADAASAADEARVAGDGRGIASAAAGGGATATVRFVAIRDLGVAEHVEIDYGGRSNAEMLTTHGFAIYANAHESLPLSLAPTAGDPLGAIKAKILAAGNLSVPFALSVGALHTDSDLLVALRILVSSADELKHYSRAFRGEPVSERNERRWRVVLRQHADALLREREAQTTAEEDAALLAALPLEQASGRKAAALVTRLGEKRLLARVLAELEKMRSAVSLVEQSEARVTERAGVVVPR